MLCALCSVLCALCSVLCALCSVLSVCHWKCLSDFPHFRSGSRYSDRCLVQISDYKLDLNTVKAYRLNDKNATPKSKCMLTKLKENYRSRSYREANPGALCPVLSALCSLPCALCPVLSALCSLPCALCPVLSALRSLFAIGNA